MPHRRLLPKSYSYRLILMMFFLGLIPFIIFGFLIDTFDRQFRNEIDRALRQGYEEEDRRSAAVLTQMAEDAIRQKAMDVALQLELFFQAHAEMTAAQLQRNTAFREIAIQPVLHTGYTAVFDAGSSVTLCHRNPEIENLRLSSLAAKLGDFWSVIERSLGGKYSHGYYEWLDADGELRTKYMYIAPIEADTADGKRFAIAATAYVEEFTRPIRTTRDVSRGTSRFLVMTFQQLVGTFRQRGFLFFGIGLCGSLALAFWSGLYFSRTLNRLRGATRAVIRGRFDVRVRSNMTGDMGELSEDFNRMVAHLEATTVRKEELEAKQEELREANLLLHQEVSERRGAEKALRESEERLKAIIETNPNPIVVYDHRGDPEYLNFAFTHVFGWDLDDLRKRHIPFDQHDFKDAIDANAGEASHSGTIVSFESLRQTKTDDVVDVLISAAPFTKPDGQPAGLVVNFTDITELKKLKAQLQTAQKMEAIGTLAGGIAHNFNNVLMGIQGMTTLMLLEKSDSHPDYQRLRSIIEYSNGAAELTKDLLAFARGGKYEVKATDLNHLIRRETEMFARTKKELRVTGHYDEALWSVEVDQGQMRQVMMNLYVNAWQAMPSGGDLNIRTENVVINEKFDAPFEIRPGKYVKIALADTGIGMDPETLQKIFDPFFTTKKMGRGTGLGLASVYGIVKNHSGFIIVNSEKGEGTTFNVYLPASAKKVDREQATSPELLRGTETVLLVDDEQMILEVGREMLETLGYGVLTAESGEEAVERYERNRHAIDIVILDMVMPGMGAEETYEMLKAGNPDIRVLLSSGYSLNGRAEKIMMLGCNGFIQKPFNLENLSRKIRKIIDDPEGSGHRS